MGAATSSMESKKAWEVVEAGAVAAAVLGDTAGGGGGDGALRAAMEAVVEEEAAEEVAAVARALARSGAETEAGRGRRAGGERGTGPATARACTAWGSTRVAQRRGGAGA